MSLKDAERTLKGMGRTIGQNTPGPKELAQAAREVISMVWLWWIAIAFMLLFGEPIVYWLTH